MISTRLFIAAAFGLASVSAFSANVTVVNDGTVAAEGETLSSVAENIVSGSVIQIGADFTESGRIAFESDGQGDASLTVESDTAGTVRKIDAASGSLFFYNGTGTMTLSLNDVEINNAPDAVSWAYSGKIHLVGDNVIFRNNANAAYVGGIFFLNDTLTISGTTTFCDNWVRRSSGSAIYVIADSDGTTIRDGVIFNGAGSVSTFGGNTCGDSRERAFDVTSSGGNVVITDAGTYSFGGGIYIAKDSYNLAGALKISNGANVTFEENAVNRLDGATEISGTGTHVVFKNANDANTFSGNFTVGYGASVEFLGGGALSFGNLSSNGTLTIVGNGESTSLNVDRLDFDNGSLVLKNGVNASVSSYFDLTFGSLTLDGSSITFSENYYCNPDSITLANGGKISSSASELEIGNLTENSSGTIETTSENSVLRIYGENTLGTMTLNVGTVRDADGKISGATGTLKLGKWDYWDYTVSPTLGAGSVINACKIQTSGAEGEYDLSRTEINFVKEVYAGQSTTLKTAKNFTGDNALSKVSLSAAGTLENTGDLEIADALMMSYSYTDWDGTLKTTGNLSVFGKISSTDSNYTADGVIQAANVTIDLSKQGNLELSDELSISAKTLDEAGTLGNLTFTGTSNGVAINSVLTAGTLTVGASDANAGTTKITVAASSLSGIASGISVNSGGALSVSGDYALSGKNLTLGNGATLHVDGALTISDNASVNLGEPNGRAGIGMSALLSASGEINVSGNVDTGNENVVCALYGGRGYLVNLETTGDGADIVFENNTGYGIYANGVKLVSKGDIVFNGNQNGAIAAYVHSGWYCGGAELYADGDISLATRNDSVNGEGSFGHAAFSAGGNITINARSVSGNSITFERGNVVIGSYDTSENPDDDNSVVTMNAYWSGGVVSFKEATTLTVNKGWTLYVDADGLDALGTTTLAGTLDLSFQHNDKINLAQLTLLGGAEIYSKCTESDNGATMKIGTLTKSENETETASIEVVRGGISVGSADAWSVDFKAGTDAETPGSGAIVLGADSASTVNLHASKLSASGTLTINGATVLDNGTTIDVAGTQVANGTSLKFVGNVSDGNTLGKTISVGENANLEIDGSWKIADTENTTSVTNAGTINVSGRTEIASGATLAIVGSGNANAADFNEISLYGNLSLSNGANVRVASFMSDYYHDSSVSVSVDASKLTFASAPHFRGGALTLSNNATVSVESGNFYIEPMMTGSINEDFLTVNGSGTIETLGENSRIFIYDAGNHITLNGKLTLSAGVKKDENGNVTDATGTLQIDGTSIPSSGDNLIVNAGTLSIYNYTETTLNMTGTEFNILKNIIVERGTLQTGGNVMNLKSAKIGQSGNGTWENYASVEISEALQLGKNADGSVAGTLRAAVGNIAVYGAITDTTGNAAARGTISANNVTIDISNQTQALTDSLNIVAKSTDENGTETLGSITFTGTRDDGNAYEIGANLTAAQIVVGDEDDTVHIAASADLFSEISGVVINQSDKLSVTGNLSLKKLSLSENGQLNVAGNLEIETIFADGTGHISGSNITMNETLADNDGYACSLRISAAGTLALKGTNQNLAGNIIAETLEVSGTTTFSGATLNAGETDVSGTLNLQAQQANLGDVSVLKTGTLTINGETTAIDVYSKSAIEIGENGCLNVEGDITTKMLSLSGGALRAEGEILVSTAIENATGKISGAEIMLLDGISGTAELEAAGTLTLVGDSTAKSVTAGTLEVAGNARFSEVSAATTNIAGVMTIDGTDTKKASSLGEISGAGTLVLSGKTTLNNGLRFADDAERTRTEITSGAEISADVYFSGTESATLAIADATLLGNISFTGKNNVLELDGATLTGTLSIKNTDLTIETANAIGDISVSAGTLTMACTGAFGNDTTQIELSDGAHLKIGAGVELNTIVVSLTLNESYLSEAAILFEANSMLQMLRQNDDAEGLTILVDGDAAALDLLFENTDVGFKLFEQSLLSATDVIVELDDTLQAEIANRGFVYNVSDGSLSLSIPEPSTFGLLTGLGALALVVSRRRRKS